MSRALKTLVDLKLITKSQQGRSTRVELLCEDGSGEPYQKPGPGGAQYFPLLFDYWLEPTIDGKPLADQLGLPGKAMLLIMLSETQGRDAKEVTAEQAARDYGISAASVDRGHEALTDADLMLTRKQWKKAFTDRGVPGSTT